VIGLDVGEAETEAFWRSFLRSLVKRGLQGVQLVVSDAHEGLKAAIAQVLGCPWQRSTVHFLREALGHARKDQRGMLAALLRPLFNAGENEGARAPARRGARAATHAAAQGRRPARGSRGGPARLLRLPPRSLAEAASTNPLEGVNREIGRRTDVVGIFPNDRSLIRLAGSVVIEQNDEWLVGHRYLSNHSLEAVLNRERGEDSTREEARELTAA
jgi:putative transposase